ncbi:Bacterial type II secretion system protein F domain protein [Actinomadura rubteroloni]|uniref:Bacterial type II secretion system protein F domain protein n=1 Tax=Actinomadura rubteroloni TaxID=1926885 RepID=A0A2P4UPR8_9ACTN|nr:type II secretion system F family protein [Actinomadura rubteroloni]POM27047.1 Bacterial type II secretion system protein F domain protein [Actinomadura rubteroloni]
MLLLLGMVLLALAALLVLGTFGGRRSNARTAAGGVQAIERSYAPRVAGAADVAAPDEAFLPVFARLALRLSRADKVDRLRARLDVAGNPEPWTPDRMLSFKGVGLVGGALVGVLFGLSAGVGLGFVFVVGLAAFGFFLPDILLYNAGIKRQDQISQSLPDLLDLLGISVQAGLGFDAALTRVALSIEGPLGREMARLLQEMRLGASREEALKSLADRTSVDELQTFTAALVQAAALGIPVGDILREQASELRIKRRQTAEERAQKVSVKITFPVVVCILPALFIIVIGPGILSMISSGVFG